MHRRQFLWLTAAACGLEKGRAEQAAAGIGPKLVAAARRQIGVTTTYDPAYATLGYPGGDVPMDRGVCTDVVIRAFRAAGLDLQQLVHEDMSAHFSAYPQLWRLRGPDRNIDHRRVPNLITFFTRRGKKRIMTNDAADYRPGDLVTCTVPPHLPHIMMVVDATGAEGRPMILHNIGRGTREEDRLFEFKRTGHFRWD